MIITNLEMEILTLIDQKNLSIKKVSEKLNISKRECEKTLKNVRSKIYQGIINNETFEIEKPKIQVPKENICKFRCAVCGKIYEINYKEEQIICPLCFSSKVMDKKTANI